MITLKQFNEAHYTLYINRDSEKPFKNGIECPTLDCGEELVDLNPQMISPSYPPCKHVFCESCGFEGCRVA